MVMKSIFVGGSQRSGTSMLSRILSQGPETPPALAECAYLRVLVQAYQLGQLNFEGETSSYFESRETLQAYHSRLIRDFLEYVLQRYAPVMSLVLKEPHMTLLFPELYQLLPESKFVLIVRDPRDIVVSMLKVGERMAQQGKRSGLFQRHMIPAMVNEIKRFYAPSLVYRERDPGFRNACHYLKYEALVREPVQQVEALRRFTGLSLSEFDPQQPLQSAFRKDSEQSQRHSFWRTELSKQPISDQSVAQFQDSLTPDEIALIEREGADFMTAFGYQPVSAIQPRSED